MSRGYLYVKSKVPNASYTWKINTKIHTSNTYRQRHITTENPGIKFGFKSLMQENFLSFLL